MDMERVCGCGEKAGGEMSMKKYILKMFDEKIRQEENAIKSQTEFITKAAFPDLVKTGIEKSKVRLEKVKGYKEQFLKSEIKIKK